MRGSTWLAVLLVAVGLPAAPAIGAPSAGVVAAEPAPGARVESAPATVRLVLPVRPEAAFLRLRVTTAAGAPVSGAPRRDPGDPRAIVAPLDAGARGPLVVTWRALTEDGHPAGGAYGIGVGAPAPAAGGPAQTRSDHAALPVLARLLALAGPLGLLGLIALSAGVVAPAVRAGGIVVPGEGAARTAGFRAEAARALAGAARGWWRAWWALAAAAAVGLALLPVAVLHGLRQGPGGLGTLLGETRFGHAWTAQVVGLVAAVLAAVVVRRRTGPGRAPDGGPAALAMGAGPLLALAAISWGGHASAGGDATLDIAIDLMHGIATAAWIGGLVGLAVLVSPALARLDGDDRVRLAAAVVVRFSALALTAVAVLVVTGVYRALAEVPVGDLLDTGYGRVLLVKLGLFALLLVAGAYNRLVVHVRLERAALGLDPGDRGAAAALRLSVRAELALAAGVLVTVALLLSIAPPG